MAAEEPDAVSEACLSLPSGQQARIESYDTAKRKLRCSFLAGDRGTQERKVVTVPDAYLSDALKAGVDHALGVGDADTLCGLKGMSVSLNIGPHPRFPDGFQVKHADSVHDEEELVPFSFNVGRVHTFCSSKCARPLPLFV